MARRIPKHKIVEANVRRLAAERGMELVDVAAVAEVSRRHLYAFFRGEKDMTLGRLVRVADALDVDVVELLADSG